MHDLVSHAVWWGFSLLVIKDLVRVCRQLAIAAVGFLHRHMVRMGMVVSTVVPFPGGLVTFI
jgi:hypothetical protein